MFSDEGNGGGGLVSVVNETQERVILGGSSIFFLFTCT